MLEEKIDKLVEVTKQLEATNKRLGETVERLIKTLNLTSDEVEIPKDVEVYIDSSEEDDKIVSDDHAANLRKEGVRLKKSAGAAAVKKVLSDFGYNNISSVKEKDYDAIMTIFKSM